MNGSDLNEKQREAVYHRGAPLLILAGAGTGKTRTLAFRIVHLVKEGVPAESVLAVAFTNKSAGELKERVMSMLPAGGRAPLVCTFHSFCVRVLRQEIEALGYKKNFTIYDTADQLSVVREVAREVRLGRRDLDAKRILWSFSRAKNEGGLPDVGDGSDEYTLLAARLFPRYSAALRAYNAVDFDDLLLLTLRLFRENPDVLLRWKGRVSHTLIDEFQDTNAVQYALVKLLAAPEGNLTVVGDDDQSIYGWRGALPGNIFGFTADWPSARVVTLEQNYRSTNRILSTANAVICKNSGRREKQLWSLLGEGSPVVVLSCANGEEEAEAVVARMVSRLASGRARPSDFAVIYRTNAQSRPFEDALRRVRLRYVVIGGMRFYDRKEVRDLTAYLSAVHNRRDEVSLLRVINYPPRGIGRETVQRLQRKSLESGRPLSEILASAGDVEGIGPRQSGRVADFLKLLERTRVNCRPGRLAEGARQLIRDAGLEDAIVNSVKDRETGMRKIDNLREVVTALAVFEKENPKAGLGDYLAAVNLSGCEDEEDGTQGQAVSLLTVHSAKGLEYPHVFLTGLEEGLLPHERSLVEENGLEEERRLAYVGMTRARHSLCMTYAAARTKWAKETPAVPSRFLDELPEGSVIREDRHTDSEPGEDEMTAKDFFRQVKGL